MLPDLDGDGGDELLARSSHGRQIFLSSQLDPASALESDDTHALLVSSAAYEGSLPVLVGDRDGDGVEDHAWMLRGGSFELCFVDPAPLPAGGEVELEAASPACVDQLFEDIDDVRLEHAVGDDTADVVLAGLQRLPRLESELRPGRSRYGCVRPRCSPLASTPGGGPSRGSTLGNRHESLGGPIVAGYDLDGGNIAAPGGPAFRRAAGAPPGQPPRSGQPPATSDG
jgi:hypothetical protein